MLKNRSVNVKRQISLMIMCWAVYAFAYLGRYAYNSNVGPITAFYGIGEVEFAIPTTLFFFSYGAGLIFNAFMCKRYNLKLVITLVLIVSSLVNISVFLGVPFSLIKYLWLLNGICQSALWPSLILILSQHLEERYMKASVIIMSSTVSVGTVISYGTSGIFATFNGFKYSFFLAAIIMSVVAVIWFFIYGFMIGDNLDESRPTGVGEGEMINVKPIVDRKVYVKGVLLLLALYGGYAVIINFIKDGLHTWVPKILKDSYVMSDSFSIIMSLVLPVFGVFGATLAVLTNKIIKKYFNIIGLFFAVSFLCMLFTAILLKTEYWLPVIILFGLTSMLMHGANNVITSMLPLSYGKKYNAGLIAGLLNGACYIGSMLSQIIVAAIAEANGWQNTVKLLTCVCFVPVIISAIIFTAFLIMIKNNKKHG